MAHATTVSSFVGSEFIHGVGNAVYDTYVKMPYDLVVNNTKKLTSSSDDLSVTDKVVASAKIFGGCVYSLLLYGSTSFLAGKSIVSLGQSAKYPFLEKLGRPIQKIGEKIFLAGAVPLYGLFYELPKNISNAIPEILQATFDKIHFVATWTFEHVVVPAIDMAAKIIKPIGQMLRYVAIKAWNAVQSSLVAVANAVEVIVNWCFTHVIRPIADNILVPMAKCLHRAVVVIGECIHKAISVIGEGVINGVLFVARKISAVCTFVIDHIVIPLWKSVLAPVLESVANIFHWACAKTASLVSFVTKKIAELVVPLFHAIGSAYHATARVIIDYLILPIRDYLLYPLCRGACFVAKKIALLVVTTFRQVVLPIGKATYFVVERSGSLMYQVFQKVVVPITQGVSNGVSAVANGVNKAGHSALSSVSSVWNEVSKRRMFSYLK